MVITIICDKIDVTPIGLPSGILVIVMSTDRGDSSTERTYNVTIKSWCENVVTVSLGGVITTIMIWAIGDLDETLTITIEGDKLDHNQKEIKVITAIIAANLVILQENVPRSLV